MPFLVTLTLLGTRVWLELKRTRFAVEFFFLRVHHNTITWWLAGSPNWSCQIIWSRNSDYSHLYFTDSCDCSAGFDSIRSRTNLGGNLWSSQFHIFKYWVQVWGKIFLKGVTFPAMHALWSRWAPPLERSKLVTAAYSGSYFGTVISMAVSGLLAEEFGWSSIFYVSGKTNYCLWIWSYIWRI